MPIDGTMKPRPATMPPGVPCMRQPSQIASCIASGPGSSMQTLSACMKERSSTQRRDSTTSRCMIAICPAGPPKEMKPSFSQKRNASRREGCKAALPEDEPAEVGDQRDHDRQDERERAARRPDDARAFRLELLGAVLDPLRALRLPLHQLELALLELEGLALPRQLLRLVVPDLLQQCGDPRRFVLLHRAAPQGAVIGEYQGSFLNSATQALIAGKSASR